MDTSNPVMSSDRTTVEEILERSAGVKRQDLSFLGEVAKTAKREHLFSEIVFPPLEVKQIVAEFKKNLPKVDSERNGELDDSVFEVVMEKMPVCGLMDEQGIPLHPAGKNQTGGHVKVNRVFGKTAGAPLGLAEIVEVFGPEVLQRKSVYTSGTWQGFKARLKQQMSRKTVSLYRTMSQARGAAKLGLGPALDQLDKWMPRGPNPQWPGVKTDIVDALMGGIKVTSNSSAGAPYWRNKGECMEQIINVGLPIFVKAVKENRLDELWRKNPEFFLCEVKNKTDRYKIGELTSKTRPYVSVPAHIAFMVSMLSQGFQETLKVFTEDPSSSNAYGFSSTNGGLSKMVSWMRGADKRGRVCCYGDDARIAVLRDGKVWVVDPDFKQMDGSIDGKDIELTIEWILRHLRRDLGVPETPAFWDGIAKVWKKMATDPYFVVDGTNIYRKKSKNGLMTGIPGTTLFDTVKSVGVWNTYLDTAQANGWNPLDEQRATDFMSKNGMVIKPGTWNPAVLPEDKDQQLLTDHKFLGTQIRCVDWEGQIIHVPTIPESDALEMLITQKDDPFTRVSDTTQKRTLYERMRGLFITFGFENDRVASAIHNVVNRLPAEIILMQTQVANGERPEHITLQDFNYPDSSGFPTKEFCYSLYSGLKSERYGWKQIFPDMEDLLEDLKSERRQLGRKLRLALAERSDRTRDVMYQEERESPPWDDVLEVAEAREVPNLPSFNTPNVRSEIAKVVTSSNLVPAKRLPTRSEVIYNSLLHMGGLTTVGELKRAAGVQTQSLVVAAQDHGIFMTGTQDPDLCSLYPVATPTPTVQETLITNWQKSKDKIDQGSSHRRQALIALAQDRTVRTAPEKIFLANDILVAIPDLLEPKDPDLIVAALNAPLTRLYGGMKWVSHPPQPKEPNPVKVTLYIGTSTRMERVAEARSASIKLAKAYIARMIFELNGFETEETRMTTTVKPIQKKTLSWADEVEQEDALKGPYAAPPTESIVFEAAPNLDRWKQDYPLVPDRLFPLLWKYAVEAKEPTEQVFARLLSKKQEDESRALSGGIVPPTAEQRSKRSRLNLQQRQRQNRALNARRRKKGPTPN
uniref:RdRp n=1 Tax=Smithfield permutotetra-like virus TaxID=2714905 RepID=A0A6G7M5K8_9VIRU|nr:hypothetical protein [Smithfield permutotetra-like virus]